MSRSFNAIDLVALPRLDVRGALSLSAQILAVADEFEELPAAVVGGIKDIRSKRTALHKSLSKHDLNNDAPLRAKEIDRRVDAAWAALLAWLDAWCRIPDPIGDKARAQEIRNAIFPDGLKFTLLPFRKQWAECDVMLSKLDSGGHSTAILNLGGEPFLQVIRAAHKEYGKVLGITVAPKAPKEGNSVRANLDALLAAIRFFVVQVCAFTTKANESKQAVASRLVQPITEWQSRSRDLPSVEPGSPTAAQDTSTPTPPNTQESPTA